MDEAYRRFAGYLGVGVDEVHLGPSTSQNTYVLERALRSMWREGDEIVVSNQDHEANARAWRRLADTGIVVREWRIDRETGNLDPRALDDLLSERTRMVAFPHCSNVVAAINPVAEISARAHEAGAIAVVDGVAWAPHGLPDVGALEADVYLFSLYKTWGPHLGLMTVKRELLGLASHQGHFFNAGETRKRLLPAGPDHAQIAASVGVCDYLDAVYDRSSTIRPFALSALSSGLAEEVIEGDREVDEREVQLEESCLKVLALHQTVANDLRFGVAVMKVNNDLDRVGDLADNIAGRAKFLARQDGVAIPTEISEMSDQVRTMLRESLSAVIHNDTDVARKVLRDDEAVDQRHKDLYRFFQERMQERPQQIESNIHLLSVSRYLERIADLATNFAEDVVFMVDGEVIRHRPW